jgi:hypothetical protein
VATFTPILMGDGFTRTDSFNVIVAACADIHADTEIMKKYNPKAFPSRDRDGGGFKIGFFSTLSDEIIC